MKKVFTSLKRNKELICTLIFSVFMMSCGDEADFWYVGEEKEPDSYSKENVFLDEKDMSLIISRTDKGVVLFSDKTPLNKLPEVGKVLALPTDEQFPIGYYGKVKEINKTNGALEVKLEPATIAELYPDTVLYYKGPVYALNSSRGGDDINVDVNVTLGLFKMTGEYTMVSPEVEYKIITANGKEVGRTFRIISRVKTETEIELLGKEIDKESDPIWSVYLVGGKFSKYLSLGIKADFGGCVVGEFDSDVSFYHTMHAQMDVGYNFNAVDSVGSIINNFDVAINDFKWSKFEKAKGDIGFGLYVKAYTDGNILNWKFDTDDNLYLKVASYLNFNADFDYSDFDCEKFDIKNFDHTSLNKEIEVGLKCIVDAKAGVMVEDDDDNSIFKGWSDSADWEKKLGTFLIWPDFSITNKQLQGTPCPILELYLKKNASILAFCDKVLVLTDYETNKICDYRTFSFDNQSSYVDIKLEGLDPNKYYWVYPAIKLTENKFLRVSTPDLVGPYRVNIPGSDFVLP